MENKSHALWAGFFTIVMLCAAIFAGIWLNSDRTERIDYHILTSKPVSGLNPQATVRYKGLAVGRVDQISFDPNLPGKIDIRIGIDPKTPITQSTFATLGYQGVTGIAFIQLDDDGSKPVRVSGGDGEPLYIPLRDGLFDKLERSSSVILTNAELVSERLAQFFTSDNQKIMLDAFANATQTLNNWDSVANELRPTLQMTPLLAKQMNQTLLSVQELTQQATQLSQQLTGLAKQLQDVDGPIAHFGGLTERMQTDTLPKITELTNEATSSMQGLNKLLEEISDRPQNLIFGKPASAPGPGEAGFTEPEK